MNYKTISMEKREAVGVLFLDRPKVLNALSQEMREELIRVLDRAAEDHAIKALIITGKGKAFCAGADLHEFKAAYEAYRREGGDHKFGRPDLAKAFIGFPKPLIAAVNGAAYGFGLTVTLTCDIRIASDRARFGCPFLRVGVTPEFGSSYLLPRLIGQGNAAELVLTARTVDSKEALEIGLVNRIVSHKELLDASTGIARTIAGMPSGAATSARGLLMREARADLDHILEHESSIFRSCTKTEEHYRAVCKALGATPEEFP